MYIAILILALLCTWLVVALAIGLVIGRSCHNGDEALPDRFREIQYEEQEALHEYSVTVP